MNFWRKIFVFVFVLIFGTAVLAVDTKYFCSFTYKQKGIRGSDFTFTPEFRLENGARELYYYKLKAGYLFRPKEWLNLGFYFSFLNDKTQTGAWNPDHVFEFVVDPKIIFDFSGRRVGAGVEREVDDLTKKVLDVLSYAELEVHDFDMGDLSKTNLVGQVRPGLSWQYGEDKIYVKDDIFYTFLYGHVYRNWVTLGIVRPLNGLSLDLYYTYENEQPGYINPWEQAHVLGTRLIWDRR